MAPAKSASRSRRARSAAGSSGSYLARVGVGVRARGWGKRIGGFEHRVHILDASNDPAGTSPLKARTPLSTFVPVESNEEHLCHASNDTAHRTRCVTIEHISTIEHLIHVDHIGHVPTRNVLVETFAVLKTCSPYTFHDANWSDILCTQVTLCLQTRNSHSSKHASLHVVTSLPPLLRSVQPLKYENSAEV